MDQTTLRKAVRSPGFWISAAGLLLLAVFFGRWCRSQGDSVPGVISALVSAVLYAVVCLRFVPQWMDFWRRPAAAAALLRPAERADGEEPRHMGRKIFAALLLVSGVVVLLVYVLRLAFGHTESFRDSLAFWRCTDSAHYLDIARDWYLSEGEWDRLVQLVFLPGYPLAVRLVRLVVGDHLYSGMIVSALAFGGAGCVTYRLLRLDYPHREALRAVRFLCLLPGAFFFTAPMSESLFLLLCVSCIYCGRTGKWLAGCLLGGLAAFTRSLGLVLCVPLFFELVSRTVQEQERRGCWVARFAALLLIPAGFGVYCLINYRVSGDPFQFMEYQRVHWSQNLGWFFNTAGYQMELAIGRWATDPTTVLGLWLPNLLAGFLSLAVMIPGAKKLRPSYTAWFLVYYLVAMGATWLLSAPRYLVVLLPVPLAVSRLAKRRAADVVLTALCVSLNLLYLCAFVLRWQVW